MVNVTKRFFKNKISGEGETDMKKAIVTMLAMMLISSIPAMGYEDEANTGNVSGYVSSVKQLGSIAIAEKGKMPVIYVDKNDYAGVVRVAGDLRKDIKAVTGLDADITNTFSTSYDEILQGINVIIGTIGKSEAIDQLIASNKLDVSVIKGKWESFTIQNVDDTVVIVGSDQRGTIYGVYDLSEKIGVSPWYWWADVVIEKADNLYANLGLEGYTEGEPSVQYRGIFLNDEYNLNRWSLNLGSEPMNSATYEKIFELLLRLKANYLWPAMHNYSPAFNLNELNAINADRYGIVMGSSHCEMLLRNNVGEFKDFYQRWQLENPDIPLEGNDDDAIYDFSRNPEMLEAYWRERVRQNSSYENLYTVGMRGIHDGGLRATYAPSTAERVVLMEEIINSQRKILEEEIGKAITDIPQLFIPYKEAQDIYDAGMNVPDDVTLMWTNDNFGYIRQLPTEAERERSGGAGIYYHLSYYGSPRSYLWLATTQLGLIREEMTKAYDYGAQKVWIINVGDLKPAETQIEYFLELARDVEGVNKISSEEYLAQKAKRDFGFTNEQAIEYASIHTEFLRLANSRRPEHMENNLFDLVVYNEGQKHVDEFESLVDRSTALYNALDESQRPSFFQLQLYPLKSSYNTTLKYIAVDKSNLYSEQERGASVNKYADLSDKAYYAIVSDTNEYETMLGGKWKSIMNPFQTRLPSSGGTVSRILATSRVTSVPYTKFNVTIQGDGDLSFSGYTKDVRYIDIFNSGSGSFEWKALADKDWIKFTRTEGIVYDEDRIYVYIDWDNAPTSQVTAEIEIKQHINDVIIESEKIKVELDNNVIPLNEKTYVESNGYISIEAEHFSNSVSKGDYEWKVVNDFGRSGDSVKIFPNLAEPVTDLTDSAYLEYNVYFNSTGTFPIDIYRMPTLNERGTMKFAIGIDNQTPTVLTGQNSYVNKSNGTDAWGKGVMNNTQVLSTTIKVDTVGYHTIELYQIDPGVVIDKMVITTDGNKAPSYFGAPESYNSTFNNVPPTIPEARLVDYDMSNLDSTFSAKVLNTGIVHENGRVLGIDLIKVAEYEEPAKLIIASYNLNGNLVNMDLIDVDLANMPINIKSTVQSNLDLTGASSVDVMIVNNINDLQVLSPEKTYNLTELATTVLDDEETIRVRSDLRNHNGSQSLLVVYDANTEISKDTIKYIKQEVIKEDTYEQIPVGSLPDAEYNIKISVDDLTIKEKFSTIRNFEPDDEGVISTLKKWDFSIDPASDAEITLLTNSTAWDSDAEYMKMPSPDASGTHGMNFTLNDAIVPMESQKVIVSFEIALGRAFNRYISYTIKDSAGASLFQLRASPNGSGGTITVSGEEIWHESIGYQNNTFVYSNDNASVAGFTRFECVFDFSVRSVECTITNLTTNQSKVVTGRLNSNTVEDIKVMEVRSDYNIRPSYLDNVTLKIDSGPRFKMHVETNALNADVKIFHNKTKVEFLPEADGSYMLSEEEYYFEAVAEGFVKTTGIFEVSPAMESKTISIAMRETAGNARVAIVKLKFIDDNLQEFVSPVIIEGLREFDAFIIPDIYKQAKKVKSNSLTSVYQFDASTSDNDIFELGADESVIKLRFIKQGDYHLYNDYEEYALGAVSTDWFANGTLPSIVIEDGNKLLQYTVASSTHGAWHSFDTIPGDNQTYNVSFKVKFAPVGTAGNSQFALSSSDPSFYNNNINYGVIHEADAIDTRTAGHILVFEYNTGSSFQINGQSIDTDFVADWLDVYAGVDFQTRKINATITSVDDPIKTVEFNDLDFYSISGNDNFGSLYMRGARTNGTVSLDNLIINMERK